MKNKSYLVLSVMVGASVIILQTRLAMADANRALQKAKAVQKTPQKMPVQKNNHSPVVMTEELSQLVATLASAANPDDHKESVTQVVAGDLDKNELYIFGEQDVIPDDVIKEHPDTAIAVMGGDDAKAIKKIEEFKKQALLVAEKVSKERARIAAEEASIAFGLQRSIGTINRETVYPPFALGAAQAHAPDHKQELIRTVLASRTVMQESAPAPVAESVVENQSSINMANREFPKELSMQERIHQQRYHLSVQLAINEMPSLSIPELPAAMMPKPVIQLTQLEWPKETSMMERVHRERYQLHIQAELAESLLSLDKQKLEFDHGQYPLNVATVMSALHPAQTIAEKAAAQRFAFKVEAKLSQSLLAFTQKPIEFPVYIPREVQGLSVSKAIACLKQSDSLHHRLAVVSYSLPPIHAALNKALLDFAEHSKPIVSLRATGITMEKVRLAIRHEALPKDIEINSRFNRNHYTLPLTARLDHHLPAFAMYPLKSDVPNQSQVLQQSVVKPVIVTAAVTKPKAQEKKTIQLAQITKKVAPSHAKAIARVERELALGSEEPRPVVIRPDAYPDTPQSAQRSVPRQVHQEPAQVAERNNIDVPRKKLPWRKIETPSVQEKRHQEESPFNIAAMDDDMRSGNESPQRASGMRVEPDNIGALD